MNLKDRLKRIDRACYALAAAFMAVYSVGIVLCLALLKLNVLEVLGACTLFFQVMVIGYGIAIMLRMLYRMDTKTDASIELAERTATQLDDTHQELKPLIVKAEHILDRVQKGLVEDDLLKKLEGHLAAIRSRIERDTEPLKAVRRGQVPTGQEGIRPDPNSGDGQVSVSGPRQDPAL